MPACETPPRPTAPAGRLLVLICTYNEAGNLERLVREILLAAPDAAVLVMDDQSPDGTARLAQRLAEDDPRIEVVVREGERGLGLAMREGLVHAIEHGYDHVLNLDADFSHPPASIPALRSLMDRCDVAIGSRYVAGGAIVGWSWRRRLASRLVNGYARWMVGIPVRDCSGSFRCYRVEKLRAIDWAAFRAHGFAFLEELLWRCRQAGATFCETPITFVDRRTGRSKATWRETCTALRDLLRLTWDAWCGPRRRTP